MAPYVEHFPAISHTQEQKNDEWPIKDSANAGKIPKTQH